METTIRMEIFRRIFRSYLLLGLDFTSPHGLAPFLIDLSICPGLAYHTRRAAVWKTQTELCQVKLTQPHLTPWDVRCWTINQNLKTTFPTC